MRIYIATWGNPRTWRYAEYCYNSLSEKGFSTLNLVFASNDLRPDLTLIFTLDTLAYEVTGKEGFKDYRSLLSSVQSYIKNYLCVEDNVAVEVLPGVMGGRDREAGFRGNLNDTRLLALYYVYFHSIRVAEHGEKAPLEVLLDTTHGINYLITLVSEVVREASAALSTVLAEPVTLSVFNADPIPPGLGPARSAVNPCTPEQQSRELTPTLRYNPLREDVEESWDLVKYLRYGKNEVRKILSDERFCSIDPEEKQRVLETARRLVAAFRVGAVAELAVLVSSNRGWVESAESLIRRAVECWLSKAEALTEGKAVKTRFSAKLMDGFRLLIHAHAIYMGVEKVMRECTTDPNQIPLECLEKLAASLLKGSEVTKTLVSHEIGVLNSKLHKGEIPEEWTLYAKILGEGKTGIEGGDVVRVSCEKLERLEPQELDKLKRHLIAHAGFLKDVLEVKRKGGRGLVRVREACVELVNKILDRVFEDLLT